MLPSGTIYNFNIKIYIFILLIIFSIPMLFKLKMKKNDVSVIFFVTFIICFYTLLGNINGYEFTSVLLEFKFLFGIYLMLLITYFMYLFVDDKLFFLRNVIIYTIYGSMIYLFIKSYFFLMIYFKLYDYSLMKDVIFPIINYKPVGLNIIIGAPRFSFVTMDFLSVALFILYIYFRNKIIYIKFPLFIEFFYSIILFISIFSAYSRFIFIIFPILLIIVFLLNKNYKTIILAFIIGILFSIVFHKDISLIIFQRFVNQEHSDSWRIIMTHALLNSWSQSPFLGRGIGAYSLELIRDRSMPFSYEVQFVSILMQFGISFILLNIFILYFFLKNITNRTILLTFSIYISLILGSFTNQYLLSTTTGVIYVIIFIILLVFNNVNYISKKVRN